MARGDQLSRQWKLIQSLIASRMGKTASQLAAELDCHPRTAYRDLEALESAGFPLFTEQRSGKTFWSMLEGHRQQLPLPLNLTELMALYFSRKLLANLQGTAIFNSLDGLFDKVKATLPPQYLNYLTKVENSMAVGVKAHKALRAHERFQETLAAVTEATQNRRLMDIDYFTMSRRVVAQRRVAPYHVWFYDDTFYLIGYCYLRSQIRIFAVDRIKAYTISDEHFTPPEDFDPESFMEQSFGIFQGEPVWVEIRFTPDAAGYIREKVWHPSQVLIDQPDGGIIFKIRVAGLEEIKLWVMRWGAQASVLSPKALQQAVYDEATQMLNLYQTDIS